jgi:hypothetical protein
MQFQETGSLPQTLRIISVLEDKKKNNIENVKRKVNWERYEFPLAYKLSLPESNQHHVFSVPCLIFHLLSYGAGIEFVISHFTDGT